jgi:2-phospho-L-lactate guanylyltransferase
MIAVIPVKGLSDAKSRLASLLPPDARKRLVLAMLDDVSGALRQSGSVVRVLIVSPDESLARIAQRLGVGFFLESHSGLNTALQEVCHHLVKDSSDHTMMVVPVDVPLLTSDNVDEIASILDERGSPLVIAARSRDGGTNTLLRSPQDVIPTSFGPGSFDMHRHLADAKSVDFVQYRSRGLELDVDTVSDLRELVNLSSSTKTQEVARDLLRPRSELHSGS